MEFDVNAVMTIALGVFVALVARDILGVVFGRLFGSGAVTGSKESANTTVGASGGAAFSCHQ
jgi:CDP-diglyceride synthetase